MCTSGPIIILSSSPPRVFARSPTPAELFSSSPSLPSPSEILGSQKHHGPQKPHSPRDAQKVVRKTANLHPVRDGFRGSSKSADPLYLRESGSRENLPIFRQNGGLKRPKKPEEKRRTLTKDGETEEPHAAKQARKRTESNNKCDDEDDHPSGGKGDLNLDFSPLHLDRACSRRMDWTPPPSPSCDPSCEPRSTSAEPALLESFHYQVAPENTRVKSISLPTESTFRAKRRKLEVVECGSTMAAPGPSSKSIKAATGGGKPKVTKKYTTITGLATSRYELGPAASSPILQFLSATQDRALDDDTDAIIDPSVPKRTVRKARVTKRVALKPTLLSPRSALQIFDDQEALFGSASQLAREESPTLTRDIIQAMKESESLSWASAPVSSQITIPTSEPSETPKKSEQKGIFQFAKARNLWSAADRDEDNALLQVDTVDMFDSPGIRNAFTGKDVMLEPPAPKRDSLSPDKTCGPPTNKLSERSFEPHIEIVETSSRNVSSPHLTISSNAPSVGNSSVQRTSVASTSENVAQVRNISTMTRSPATSQVKGTKQTVPKSVAQTPAPSAVRPSYKGFTDNQLASQLKAYGFKPIKKRDTMIELLDRCWDNKHTPANQQDEINDRPGNETSNMTHDDILTKVHDIAARPTPKTKKPRKSTKVTKDSTEPAKAKQAAKATGDKVAKGRRKKADTDTTTEKAAQVATSACVNTLPRTKPSKASTPQKNTKANDILKYPNRKSIAEPCLETLRSESAPTLNSPSCSIDQNNPHYQPPGLVAPSPSSQSLSAPDLSTSIHKAIRSQPSSISSQRSPTFHQQILMYTPIVIEDFTRWLNTDGLSRVSYDGEVRATKVRDWCEGKGVCCFWAEGGRRQERKKKAIRGRENI